jgi:protoheme IX farnesyltransferase
MSSDVKILEGLVAGERSRILDFMELMKPELTGLSVLTALCGFYLATDGAMDFLLFLWTALGTIMVGGGAGALNQYLERDYDGMMKRTERRPLPSGRISPQTVLVFGVMLALGGIAVLSLAVNLLTGILGSVTILSYLFLYTPLKRVTPYSTLVGGIPGALPPVMGWSAAGRGIDEGAILLFAVLFFWQMPHFLSLAWMYRKDYARAKYKILSVLDEDGSRTGTHCLLHSLALLPASIGLTIAGITGYFYLAVAIFLSLGFILYSLSFARSSGKENGLQQAHLTVSSRKLFFASLVYLPVLMIGMVIDKL